MVYVLPDAGFLPFLESTPTGHAATAAHLLRKIFPWDACLEYEQNAGERLAMLDRRSSSLGTRFVRWQTGFDEFPELVREQRFGHWSVLHDNQESRIAAYSSVHELIQKDVLLGGLRNYVQTNATLLDDEFTDFFQQNGFTIGTSIQGTKEFHDSSRITAGGKPTFEAVVSNLSSLNRQPSVICVLTTELLDHEEDVYASLKLQAQGFQISEYVPGGLNPNLVQLGGYTRAVSNRPEPLMPTDEEYGKSMLKFYDIWKSDHDPPDFRPITSIIRSFVLGKATGCLYSQDACSKAVVAVKANGDFYSCIRSAPDQAFRLGHVSERPLKRYQPLGEARKSARLDALMRGPCGTCSFWKGVC